MRDTHIIPMILRLVPRTPPMLIPNAKEVHTPRIATSEALPGLTMLNVCMHDDGSQGQKYILAFVVESRLTKA